MNRQTPTRGSFQWSAVRDRFTAMTPQIRQAAQAAFASAAPKKQGELVMRTICHAQKVYLQLALHGFSDIAYPQPLAAVALAQVRAELRRPPSRLRLETLIK
ncbi:MAG: hypothetical protein JXB10_09220 [Pirellulales bacterium]|nr:hypothetical protein [Pirellulales bacterium]